MSNTNPIYNFDEQHLTNSFQSIEKLLFEQNNIIPIQYDNKNLLSFDKLNSDLLRQIAGQSMVYCIWRGKTHQSMQMVYVGHSKGQYSRQRIRNHFCTMHPRTGSKLSDVSKSLAQNFVLGFTYIVINPDYMRKPVEDWIIKNNELAWNVNW